MNVFFCISSSLSNCSKLQGTEDLGSYEGILNKWNYIFVTWFTLFIRLKAGLELNAKFEHIRMD